jgi:hypothetical protein
MSYITALTASLIIAWIVQASQPADTRQATTEKIEHENVDLDRDSGHANTDRSAELLRDESGVRQ